MSEKTILQLTAPGRVWLNTGIKQMDSGEDEIKFQDLSKTGEVTWSDSEVDAGDVEYIRADVALQFAEWAAVNDYTYSAGLKAWFRPNSSETTSNLFKIFLSKH